MRDLLEPGTVDLAPLHAALPASLHATLTEMAEHMYTRLAEDTEALQLLGAQRLAEIVIGQIDRVALALGGCQFYLPRGISCKLSARDKEIYAQYKGHNKRALARKYKLTDMRIDQIINAARRADFSSRQGKLGIDA